MMISLQDVAFGYKRKQRLFESLSLELPQGSIIGLLGRNGEGKTTMLKLIIGSLISRSGQINVMNARPSDRHPELLQKIFWLPEIVTAPAISIGSYLDMLAPFYPSYDDALATEALHIFNIRKHWKLNKVSQGQQKKAIITLALAARTPLLLMDEPTNGLDIPSKSAFRQLVAKYTNDEQTIIISTHQVRDLEALIDRVVMMDGNKIVCNETISQLSSLFSCGFVSAHPDQAPIYTEPSPMGELGIYDARINGNAEANFSMELFFNGMILLRDKFQSIISQH